MELYVSNLIEGQREKEDEIVLLEISNVELKGTIEVMEREEKKREREIRRIQGLLDKVEVENMERMSEFEGIITGYEERIAELSRELGEARNKAVQAQKGRKADGGEGTPGQVRQSEERSNERRQLA